MYVVKVEFLNGILREFPFPATEQDLAEAFYKGMLQLFMALHIAGVEFKEVKNV